MSPDSTITCARFNPAKLSINVIGNGLRLQVKVMLLAVISWR
jgi:hypothetical protein